MSSPRTQEKRLSLERKREAATPRHPKKHGHGRPGDITLIYGTIIRIGHFSRLGWGGDPELSFGIGWSEVSWSWNILRVKSRK